MRPMRDADIRGSMSDSSSSAREARPARVSAERVFELARHLTERDREIAMVLFEQQVLTTDQLALLFFSSRRRAQDRLLFLYRHRVVDRFYPPAPFGYGKAQAHWLLDEAGAILVAARLGVERKKLGWQRRDDWGSHPQLAHRLETNRLRHRSDRRHAGRTRRLGCTWWAGPAEAARSLRRRTRTCRRRRPDAGFEFVCAGRAGRVLPGVGPRRPRRSSGCGTSCAHTCRRARGLGVQRVAAAEPALSSSRPRRGSPPWRPRSPTCATTPSGTTLSSPPGACTRLRRRNSRGGGRSPACGRRSPTAGRRAHSASSPLVARRPILRRALGRRWRHDRPDFWPRLSPLGRAAAAEPREVAAVVEEAPDPAQPCDADVAQAAGATTDTDPAEMRTTGRRRGLPGPPPGRARGGTAVRYRRRERPPRRQQPRRTCVRPRSMASWTTQNPTRRGHGDNQGLHLHPHLNRRGEPADLAALAARTAAGVLHGAGGLADRRPQAGPGDRHEARPARPASRARPRPQWRDRHAARLPRRPAQQEGAPARATDRGARRARRRAEVGDGAVRHRLGRGADDAADAGGVRRVRARHHRRPHLAPGSNARAKEGRWFGGRPPFGYTFSSEERALVPDPVKAPVVRRVFDLYTRKRLGTRTIAQQLRDEGAPAPSAGWGHPAVHWIINNPTYVGKIRWRDKRLRRRARAARRRVHLRQSAGDHARARRARQAARQRHPTSCSPACCAAVSAARRTSACRANGNGGRYHYYACTGRQKYGPKACDRRTPPPRQSRTRRPPPARLRSTATETADRATRWRRRQRRGREAPTRVRATARLDRRRDRPRRAITGALLRGLRAGQALTRTLRRPAHAPPGAPRRPPRPRSRTLTPSAPRGRTGAHARGPRRQSPTTSKRSSSKANLRRRRHSCGC